MTTDAQRDFQPFLQKKERNRSARSIFFKFTVDQLSRKPVLEIIFSFKNLLNFVNMNQCNVKKNKFRLSSAGRAVCICIFCPSCCAREKSTSLNTACFFFGSSKFRIQLFEFQGCCKGHAF